MRRLFRQRRESSLFLIDRLAGIRDVTSSQERSVSLSQRPRRGTLAARFASPPCLISSRAERQAMPATQNSSSTSASLLDRVRKSDPVAWERFARLYGPLIYRWARQAGVQESDAADVSQEVFRAVVNGMDGFHRNQPGDSFRGWLWTITKNRLRDFFRHQAAHPDIVGGSDVRQRLLEIPDSLSQEGAEPPGFDAAGSLAHRALELVREEFEPRTWQAFLRVTLGGQSPAAVAEELGMSIGAVYTGKSRVLRRLREEMEGLI